MDGLTEFTEAVREVAPGLVVSLLAALALTMIRMAIRSLLPRLPGWTAIDRWRIERRPGPGLRAIQAARMRRVRYLGFGWAVTLLLLVGYRANVIGYHHWVRWLLGTVLGTGLVIGLHLFRGHQLLRLGDRVGPIGSRWSILRRLPPLRRLGITLVLLWSIGLAIGGSATPTWAAEGDAADPACDALVLVYGRDGLLRRRWWMSTTSSSAPLPIDVDVLESIQIEWKVRPAPDEGEMWTVEADTFGTSFTVARNVLNPEQTLGTVPTDDARLSDRLTIVPPGLHRIRASISNTDCKDEEAYVHVTCSTEEYMSDLGRLDFEDALTIGDLTFARGVCQATGLAWLGFSGLIVAELLAGSRIWSSRALRGVTLELIDGETGEPAIGALDRHRLYKLRAGVNLPDPIKTYQPGSFTMTLQYPVAGGPDRVTTNQIGADSTVVLFEDLQLPPRRTRMEFGLRLESKGHLLRAIDVRERSWRLPWGNRLAWVNATVSMEVGTLAADHVRNLAPIDGVITMRFGRDGRLRTTVRDRASGRGTTSYVGHRRRAIESTIVAHRTVLAAVHRKNVAAEPTEDELHEQLVAMSESSQAVAEAVFGTALTIQPELVYEIVIGDRASSKVGVPWSTLYIPDRNEGELCPDFFAENGSCRGCGRYTCPSKIWGLRGEIVTSTAQHLLRMSLAMQPLRQRRQHRRNNRERGTADSHQTPDVLEIVNGSLKDDHQKAMALGDDVAVHCVTSESELIERVASARGFGLLHVYGHGMNEGKAIQLSHRVTLTHRSFRALADLGCFKQHPIVVLNHCLPDETIDDVLTQRDGSIDLLSTLQRGGAGAVLVPESVLGDASALVAAKTIIDHRIENATALDTAALRNLRQQAVRSTRRLATIPYSFHQFAVVDAPNYGRTVRFAPREVIYVDPPKDPRARTSRRGNQ